MAFLAPLFLAGLAAIALPIILHLRRNRPKQTVAFSSLMFLEESPPVTKTRARVQDILLLILRCIALALLILAFARPYFPIDEAPIVVAGEQTMHYILIDTSASMRGDASKQAIEIAEDLISSFPNNDWIALATYSDQLRPLLTPESSLRLAQGEHKSTALDLIKSIEPDWKSSRLDIALLAASASSNQESLFKIHLISDLQKGSTLERLDSEIWPGTLQIIPHPVSPENAWTNAGVRILPLSGGIQRARITNSEGSENSDFSLTWDGQETIDISVQPGESAVFEAPEGLPTEGTVTLEGDDFEYDNSAAWVTPVLPVAHIWHPQEVLAHDPKEAAYYLNRALQSTADYTVEITAEAPTEMPALTITSGEIDVSKLLADGGIVLLSLRDQKSANAISKALGIEALETQEAKVKDHVLFGEIDFKSSIFMPFADARYSDFSSIRVWKYRLLPEALVSKARVLARFDSGDPAWLTYSIGEGSLHVLTTTWRPSDSQIALTTKFPPLLHSLVEQGLDQSGQPPFSIVGDIHDTPGIHHEGASAVSVQLDPAESERTPILESELRAIGLPLDAPIDLTLAAEIAKQLSDSELENSQRVGWWLLLGAALFFLAETSYATFAGKRRSPVTT